MRILEAILWSTAVVLFAVSMQFAWIGLTR